MKKTHSIMQTYLPLDIDYNTGEVALSWGILLENDSTIGTARTRTDTITWIALMSEAYYLNDEQQDCMGTLWSARLHRYRSPQCLRHVHAERG